MLFNSALFVFGFLPAALVAYFAAARWLGKRIALAVLTTAALVFYGKWEAWHLLVLIPSILTNFALSHRIIAARENGGEAAARRWAILAFAANLAVLGLFKYADFLLATVTSVTGLETPRVGLSLPLGISFFTFTQITYLADCVKGKAERTSLLRYAVFVTYFPHLIAGPILHHSEIIPQFERDESFRPDRVALIDGLSLFLCGLAKKMLLADPLGVFARAGFDGAAHDHISLFAAWGAALSYTFQLYFDFSGYSDMALGIARMMRIELPINFNSPYKATSPIAFWRRWHVTLSRFLRDYVYIPLGGARRGAWRSRANLVVTMLLGGLWHGAGWTFIAWGGLHGAALAAAHSARNAGLALRGRAGALLGWGLTFLLAVMGWVLFRADSLAAAGSMYRGLFGAGGAYLPEQLLRMAPPLKGLIAPMGSVPYLADGTILGLISMSVLILVSFAITLAAPNLYQMRLGRRIALAALASPFLIQALLFSPAPSEFIYFRF